MNELKITCQGCKKENISYSHYLNHIKDCNEYLKNPIFNKIIQINKKSDEIEQLKKKRNFNKSNKKKSLRDGKKLRQKYLTNELSKNDKITFYKATIEGN